MKDDGGPAFPVANLSKTQCSGMSLRDYFAGQALAGLIASKRFHLFSEDGESMHSDLAAHNAFDLADAMLEARK